MSSGANMEPEHFLRMPLSFLFQACHCGWVTSVPLILGHSLSGLQEVNSFGFWGCTVSVATTQLYFVREAAVGSAHLGGHGCVPGNPFTTTGPHSSLLIPDEKTELSAPVNLDMLHNYSASVFSFLIGLARELLS